MVHRRIAFHNSPEPTIGVEVELFIVDDKGYALAPDSAQEIFKDFEGNEHIKPELLTSIVEINTGICKNVTEAKVDLQNYISQVIQSAERKGYKIISIGTHPFSLWKEQTITDKERYLTLLNRFQWAARRLLITGTHVHIGVDSGEKAIAITNGLLRYLPQMIAISANSPLYSSEVTGLASTRTKLFEILPTSGLPHVLRNYSEFQKFMRTLKRAKTIESVREVWWDIRPHPGFGTVETRAFDAVPTLQEMVNLAAFTQCLVVAISTSYDEGTQLPILDRWIVSENKWRAARFGVDAEIIVDEDGHQHSLKYDILENLDKMMTLADTLGCTSELINLYKIVEENRVPYQRQLSLWREEKDFVSILKHSALELKKSLKVK